MPPERDLAARLWSDLLSGLSLLTRLPLPAHEFRGAAGAWAWPLAGLVLAALVWPVLALLAALEIAPGPTAAVLLAVMALLTGGLHEDGLSDTADGLIGGQTAERRLEIMKDSRIGSYGALALGLVMLCSWSALTELLAQGHVWRALATAAVLSRVPMVAIMALLPPARSTGLSAATGRPDGRSALIAALLGFGIALLLTGWAALPAALAAAILSALLAHAACNRIGGQTGDILGASQQISFAAVLALLA